MNKRESARSLWRRHREILLYLIFGVLTVAVNTAAYLLFYHTVRLSNVLSTVLAWAAAVLFAYVTNKLWVFESHRREAGGWLREMLLFFSCRLLTGVLDVGIMVLAVDLMHRNSLLWKLISNGIVTVVNYIASRFLIFKKER